MARVIDQVLGATTSSVVGEITRELVNASDGAGLHFDGAAGGINLGSSMPDLGTKYSLEFVVKGDSKTGVIYLLDAYNSSSTNRVILAWSGSSTGNIQLRINGTWSNAFIATPDNGEVVHLLLSVDGTSATLYQNGKSVSTQTVVANALTGATNTHIGTTQNGTGSFFNGTIYRCRFYNKALSSAEVQTAYERADVDFADQYGRQAVNDGGFTSASNWLTNGGWSVSGNKANFTDGGGTGRVGQNSVFTAADVGKNVHITFTVSTNTGLIWIGNSSGTLQYVDGGYNSYAVGTHTVSFTLPSGGSTSLGIYSQDAAVGNFEISNLGVHVEGAVVDLDLAFANENQSRMVADRSTNNVDGEMSSSGVKQTQVIKQLNSTSARIGTFEATPADGQILADGKSKTAPSYSFGHTTATGMYSPGANQIRFSTASTDRLTIDSSGNATFSKDIIVESGTTDVAATFKSSDARAWVQFRDDSTTDTAVMVGAEGDDLKLRAGSNTRVTISSTGEVELSSDDPNTNVNRNLNIRDTRAMAADVGGGISLFGKYNTGGSYSTFAQIVAGKTDGVSGNYDGYLAFKTRPTNSLPVERMRISSTGAVSIPSATAAGSQLTIGNVHGKLTFSNNSGTAGTTNIQQTYSGGVAELRFGSNVATTSSSAMNISTGDAGAVKFNGLATFSGGIAFPAPTPASAGTPAASSVLDVYETGTWTPSLAPGGGTFTTLTYTTQRGKYIRVGSQVWVGFEITVNAFTIGSGASYVVLNGLPFDRGAAEDQYGSGTVTQYSGWTNNAPVTLPRLNAGSCILRYATSSVDVANVPPANITAGCVMNGFMVYSV